MLTRISNALNSFSLESVDHLANKLGATSIASNVIISATPDLTSQPWMLTDYALLISAAGGVLFIIEKIFVIYIRYRESKLAAKDPVKTRNISK